ncbi:MAG TPA: LysR family transcriptional regulator [Verrucomicrobiae bacterium]|nr:LysR family transcriptional regulator [Verrucomicrobiae bacterium]
MNAPHNLHGNDEWDSWMNSPLDSRQLRAFCVLARTGSFTQTARELHLTQSAISHSMKTLECDVGCRLLHKLGKKIVLTQAGEQLLHHAAKILQEMEGARESLGHLGKWGRGRLRLGVSTTACQYILPPVLREFKESFPEHAIAIEPGDTPELVASLSRHRIDLALTLEPEREPQLDFHLLFTDELQFIVGAMHPWAQAGRVERGEIPRQNYILYQKKSLTFRLIEDYFRHEDMVLNTIIELGTMEAIKELVKLGLGVSILAPWIARKEIEERSIVALPLGRRKLQRRWGILHQRGKRLTLAEETFVSLCQTACTSL